MLRNRHANDRGFAGADDLCGEMAFLEQGRATAAVIAGEEEVEVDEVGVQELRDL